MRHIWALIVLLGSAAAHADVRLQPVDSVTNVAGFLFNLHEVQPQMESGIPSAARVFLSYNSACGYGGSDRPCSVSLYLLTQQESGDWGSSYLYSIGNLRTKDHRTAILKVRSLLHQTAEYWEYDVTCEKLPDEILEIEVSDEILGKQVFADGADNRFAVGLWVQYFPDQAQPAQTIRKHKKNHKSCEKYRYYFLAPG